MHSKDSGAFGIHVHGAVDEHEASPDWRRDQFFSRVETGNVSTQRRSPTLFDTTTSEMKDPRPITATQDSTVTHFTAHQQSTETLMTYYWRDPTQYMYHEPILCPYSKAPSGAPQDNTLLP